MRSKLESIAWALGEGGGIGFTHFSCWKMLKLETLTLFD